MNHHQRKFCRDFSVRKGVRNGLVRSAHPLLPPLWVIHHVWGYFATLLECSALGRQPRNNRTVLAAKLQWSPMDQFWSSLAPYAESWVREKRNPKKTPSNIILC